MCDRDLPDAILNVEGHLIACDPCLGPIVGALNFGGQRTIASCCGHGTSPGRVSLIDGRELLIAPDYETATRLWVRVDEGAA